MIEVNGEYTSAKIMTDNVEDYAVAQIKQLCDLENMKESKIVCMPDIHPGKVATIGFTCTQPYHAPVMPALIGNDIGCGLTMVKLHMRRKPEWKKLDVVIRENIPVGNKKRGKDHQFYKDWYNINMNLFMLHAKINLNKVSSSLATLGGGNHFIEIDKDDEDNYYLIIHSGSRSLGARVYEYWQNQADLETNGNGVGRTVARELSYLSNPDSIHKYKDDTVSCIEFARLNRKGIIKDICDNMKWDYDFDSDNPDEYIECIHNYIENNYNSKLPDEKDMTYTIRKGAIRAYSDDVIIPINMKDGVIIGRGKSNSDYNYSAPHGAGRILSRKAVSEHHTLKEFKTAMNGIYSPTISKDTLDEAPFAYRTIDQIIPNIVNSVEVKKILKPVYNYKGGSA